MTSKSTRAACPASPRADAPVERGPDHRREHGHPLRHPAVPGVRRDPSPLQSAVEGPTSSLAAEYVTLLRSECATDHNRRLWKGHGFEARRPRGVLRGAKGVAVDAASAA